MIHERYNLTNGLFEDYEFHIAEPKGDAIHGISGSEMKISRRLQKVKKPLVDGASVRDFGENEREISFQIAFHGKNYLKHYLEFEEAVNTGKPGKLVHPTYPVAMQCYFQEATVKSEVANSNMLLVSVTFVRDEVSEQDFEFATTKQLSRDDLANLIREQSALTKEKLKENDFVKAIKDVEGGLSSVRRFSNLVIGLHEAVRNKIANLQGQLEGTLGLLSQVIDATEDSLDFIDYSSGFLGAEHDREIVEISDDVETQNDTEDSLNEDLSEDEFAPEFEVKDPVSDQAVIDNLDKFSDSIASSSSDINSLSASATQDVDVETRKLVALISSYRKYFAPVELKTVLIGREVSLIEVMFANNVDINEIELTHKNNMHLDNSVVIPAGEVVYL